MRHGRHAGYLTDGERLRNAAEIKHHLFHYSAASGAEVLGDYLLFIKGLSAILLGWWVAEYSTLAQSSAEVA